jgi:hypothetical protein
VTGRSRGIPGHDLLLVKGDKGVRTDLQEAVTLGHELGHNLGLGHGGRERTDDPYSQGVNNKANYLSIMNYYFNNTGLQSNSGVDGIIGFSPQEFATLDTDDLNEAEGLDPDPFAHLRANFKCANSGKAFDKASVVTGDGWGGIDWGCDGTIRDGSSNRYLQEPCTKCDSTRVYSSEDYHHLQFWGVGQGWDSRSAAMVSFDQPGTAEPTIAQAQADGVWWPMHSLVTPGSVELTAYAASGVVDIPISLANAGTADFGVTPRLAVAPPGLSLAGAPVTLAAGARQGIAVRFDTSALPAGSDADAEVEYIDDVGEALGSTHVTVHLVAGGVAPAACDEARTARADAGLPPEQAPALDAFIARCNAPVPQSAPKPCVDPKTSRTFTVHLRGAARKSGVVKPKLKLTKQIGAKQRSTYKVKLTRACVTIATGTIKGKSLVLKVKSVGTKTVKRKGHKVKIRTYPRLKGTYVFQANGGKNKIKPVKVKFS